MLTVAHYLRLFTTIYDSHGYKDRREKEMVGSLTRSRATAEGSWFGSTLVHSSRQSTAAALHSYRSGSRCDARTQPTQRSHAEFSLPSITVEYLPSITRGVPSETNYSFRNICAPILGTASATVQARPQPLPRRVKVNRPYTA